MNVARWFFNLCILSTCSIAYSTTTSHAILDYNDRFHPTRSTGGMVVSQERLASEVGAQILQQGGNAIDAAVATGFALAVTLPQAGNLGGGGFMVVHLAEPNRTFAIDYRETAPIWAYEELFQTESGDVDNQKARYSYASTGVPGTVAGLLHAHEHYGKLPIKRVMQPAIDLAQNGITITDSLAASLHSKVKHFKTDPSSVRYFMKGEDTPFKAGDHWVQKDLAKSLKLISKHGTQAFYNGAIADLLVAEMEANGGLITKQDLREYKAIEREVIRGEYKGYEIASMPPPSSGGIHLVQMLNIIETAEIAKDSHNSAGYLHLLVNAMKRAYADRSEFLGDPGFVDIPTNHLTSKRYAQQLAAQFTDKATPSSDIKPGKPTPKESMDTTHYSTWDQYGNVVSNTYTLNFSFGNGKSVDGAGFLLNNEMDDFSAKPGSPNGYGLIGGHANAIEPRKRPLSSMTPTIVFKDGKPYMTSGSPGGSTIITAVLQNILNVIEFDMNAAEATYVPRIHHQWLPDKLFYEEGISKDTLNILEQKGYVLKKGRAMGRVQAIVNNNGVLEGASDTRWPDGGAISAE